MEFPRLGVESELQLPAHTTAIATPYLSCVFDLHHSPRQHQILNAPSEARGRSYSLMVTSQIYFRLATTGTPKQCLLTIGHSSNGEFLMFCRSEFIFLVYLSEIKD